MKILIDINHPAHVHYFRNFIKLMEARGHEFCVINRDSNMINQLLDYYGIEHTIRNKRPAKKGTLASLLNLARMTGWCIRKSLSFHPDMYVGFASFTCALTSWLFGKPSILLDDTEHNTMNHRLYLPFCSVVLTPFYFKKTLGDGSKQLRFDAYVEQLYLHSKYYQSRQEVLNEQNVKPNEYVLVRYIAYDAHHDLAAHPLSADVKKQLVKQMAQHYRVFVSLEKENDDSFYDEYKLRISPEKMHDLEANARFMITEGATMASESFVLGVPYLYLNPLRCGNIDYQYEHYPATAFQTTDESEAIAMLENLMRPERAGADIRADVESRTIAPTDFLVWFIENYPESKRIMRENPAYQERFR